MTTTNQTTTYLFTLPSGFVERATLADDAAAEAYDAKLSESCEGTELVTVQKFDLGTGDWLDQMPDGTWRYDSSRQASAKAACARAIAARTT